MKKKFISLLSRLLQFIICNLAVFFFGLLVVFLSRLSFFSDLAEHRFYLDLIYDLSMSVGLIIPFCSIYMLNNSEYKRVYLKNRECGYSTLQCMREHVKSYAKYELWLLLTVSLVLSFVPFDVLGKIGVGFMLASASFFLDFLPNYVFHNSSFILRVLAWIIWDGYIVVLYFVCLKIAFWIWEKNKLRKFDKGDYH